MAQKAATVSKNFYPEVVEPNAMQVGGDKWLMLSIEGFRLHRRWVGGFLSCLPNK